MDKIKIFGKIPLKGTVSASGSKNAALPILIAGLLTDKESVFKSIPRLQDIHTILKILNIMGVESQFEGNLARLKFPKLLSMEASYELVRKMRASVLVMGPLLTRFGYAKVSLPGGCAIGARPINYHLEAFKALGAQIDLEEGYVIAKAKKLKGTRIEFPFPSVGATENTLLAAVLAQGETQILNAACEPEIVDLAKCLRSMGAQIEGEGSSEILVQGKESLKGAQHQVTGDRIEAGTYLASALMTSGDVTVDQIEPKFLKAVLEAFDQMGATVRISDQKVQVIAGNEIKPLDIVTAPYPGFPTDMQAQIMAVLALAKGESKITETIFENRFMHVPELNRLGTKIRIQSNTAFIQGVNELKGAPLMATDLRASASLVLGGLASSGETLINRVYHLDRGYEQLEDKFRSLGARIERVN